MQNQKPSSHNSSFQDQFSSPYPQDRRNSYLTRNHNPSYYNRNSNVFTTPNQYHPSESDDYSSMEPRSNMSRHYSNSNFQQSPYISQDYQAEKPIKKRRRYCCCFSKKACIVFSIFMLFLLAGLAVAGYFLWPRIPNAKLKNIGVASTSGSSSSTNSAINNAIQGTRIETSGNVVIPLVLEISVSNPNYIPWTFNNVTADGTIQLNDGSQYKIGSGGLSSPFTMPRLSENNPMLINFNFVLDPKSSNFVSAANLVKSACTAGGPAIKLNYVATIHINAISWLGIRPTVSDSANFNCPISDLQGMGIDVPALINKLLT
ncbi:hypothetical protein BB559_000443 [Furculomyces boomerangus]|uniref:Late embryogenesis abundant protein LEA-2 subgroup domain-containing protein n=2 Tax=Harpellales TaxID=61421 RepID=A0A2T9Z541_9FUNG|nr:hypothetical protein BB559_000443 [Furculomyces boomerangus]PVZ98347.1 hypothetical protein BB558_005647 [Smittium angustum]PWA02659.1 hypothetical protein BB558_001215 [Smittium angustum]